MMSNTNENLLIICVENENAKTELNFFNMLNRGFSSQIGWEKIIIKTFQLGDGKVNKDNLNARLTPILLIPSVPSRVLILCDNDVQDQTLVKKLRDLFKKIQKIIRESFSNSDLEVEQIKIPDNCRFEYFLGMLFKPAKTQKEFEHEYNDEHKKNDKIFSKILSAESIEILRENLIAKKEVE